VHSLDLDLRNADNADSAVVRSLAHDHLASRDEAAREQIHDILAPSGLNRLAVEFKLLPVELVGDDEVAAAAALQVALLEAVVALYDFRVAVQRRAEHQPVVVHGLEVRAPRWHRRWWRRERHDVGFVDALLACWERRQGRCGCEQEMCAEAVVCVDGVVGGEGELLVFGGAARERGPVGADVHGSG
jgi:hypothetical protein